MAVPSRAFGSRPLTALTAVVSVGVAIFFALYSLIPVTRAESPGIGSLFIGTMMAFVMGVQIFTPLLIRKLSLRIVLAGSIACLALGALIASVATGPATLLVGGVVSGVGFGIMIVAGTQGVALLVPAKQLGRALGVYGLITMTATAVGAPASVHFALIFTPPAFGVGALLTGFVAVGLTFGIPPAVGRTSTPQPVQEAADCDGTVNNTADAATESHSFGGHTPWLVLFLLLLGVTALSYGLTSLPVLATPLGSAALVIFCVQAGNAVGRWMGGELEPRLTAAGTVVTGVTLIAVGTVLSLMPLGQLADPLAGAFIGIGVGALQTVTLHTAMRRVGASRAAVIWNLAVDGGLWAGGILWGLTLAYGSTSAGVIVITAVIMLVGLALLPQLRHQR